MLQFIAKMFVALIEFIGLNVNALKYVSLSNQ